MRASSRMTLHPTPPPQPLLCSINHACKFKDDITPHPPTPTCVSKFKDDITPHPPTPTCVSKFKDDITPHPPTPTPVSKFKDDITPHPPTPTPVTTMRASSRMTLHPTPPPQPLFKDGDVMRKEVKVQVGFQPVGTNIKKSYQWIVIKQHLI